jgi:hypothetical protein
VQPTQPGQVESGQPLDYAGVRITGVGPESRLHLRDFSVESPAFQRIADARDGRLSVREAQAPEQASAR